MTNKDKTEICSGCGQPASLDDLEGASARRQWEARQEQEEIREHARARRAFINEKLKPLVEEKFGPDYLKFITDDDWPF